MADKKITPPKKTAEKSLHDEIHQKLTAALSSFKGALGEKKFEKKLKKASKLFIEGIEKAGKKIKAKKATAPEKSAKKPVKKTAKAPAKKAAAKK
ncbi:MAG TPA: hypothetical protein VK559_00715 [Ferruginibacter sp.]|nr:hypothetical protein [Ferruginibacter sp.]